MSPVRGYAVAVGPEILVRTVSQSPRYVMVNALAMLCDVWMEDPLMDEDLLRLWERHIAGRRDVSLIEVEVTPVGAPISPWMISLRAGEDEG